jgi:sugar (pentulose or hexulose) kinase
MVSRIRYQSGSAKGLETKADIAACVYHSLARSYASAVKELEQATGKRFSTIKIVGGGSANEYLNQLTADFTGLIVEAGPVEATLLGNIGIQAMAAGELSNLTELRELITTSFSPTRYQPRKGLHQ